MKVLVGCEFSGIVRNAFTAKGHEAWSCDFLPSETPGNHYQGNVLNMLSNSRKWDIIIMHPDCTCVCNAGNRHYGKGKEFYHDRLSSVYWIAQLWMKCRLICEKVVFENPPGMLSTMAGLPLAQYVQPWWFGHSEQKRTGLHLHGLPDLKATNNVYQEMLLLPRHEREAVFYMSPNKDRWKDRSRTYTGIAAAMAEQWG